MKKFKRFLLIIGLIILFAGLSQQSKGQLFAIGVQGGASYSWFSSPKIDNAIISHGWGWNLGFFFKYGKTPYIQPEFTWTRSQSHFSIDLGEHGFYEDVVPFHNFDLAIKVGMGIIHKPIIKWRIYAGPFIGTAHMFSSNVIFFEKNDFRNPQFGVVAGTGIRFMNLVLSVDYQYHINELFKMEEEDLIQEDFGSHLQRLSFKIGFQF